MENLLDIQNLKITFDSERSRTEAVKGISFAVGEDEAVAIVGESGSGKSVTAMSVTRLLPPQPDCVVDGKIFYRGDDVAQMSSVALRQIRGREIAYIFQEPSTSLNPVFTVGYQIAEAVKLHFPHDKNPKATVVEALREVGIRNPEIRYNSYPHELSGGMQQRVMIAMALVCKPHLLIADEPTTALDVTIQKQIIDLLCEIRRNRKMSLLLITHNFGIISELCTRVIVMFRGRIVETGSVNEVLYNPQNPYTKALIACIPRLGEKGRRLEPIDYSKLGDF